MDGEGLIELKFRLADGSDIGPTKYSPAMTVASLKEKVVAHWPREKENGPKTLNDVKLIHAGKILENNKTLADSRLQVGELPGGVITMHVVVRPPVSDKKNGFFFISYPPSKTIFHFMAEDYCWLFNHQTKKKSCGMNLSGNLGVHAQFCSFR
ncbi:hypothetical protein EUGRSUZ_H00920 [Eucalyptus grandis]|nr:hypothetical protein EUGRSUZ_H00920 [Eucalyptus grandis]